MGIFGKLFDFNSDGRLDAGERAAEFGAFMQMMDYEKNDALSSAGIEPEALSGMGYSESISALESAGLDPSDFGL